MSPDPMWVVSENETLSSIFLQLDEVNRESASELREQLRIQKEAHTVHMAESMEMQVRGRGG